MEEEDWANASSVVDVDDRLKERNTQTGQTVRSPLSLSLRQNRTNGGGPCSVQQRTYFFSRERHTYHGDVERQF